MGQGIMGAIPVDFKFGSDFHQWSKQKADEYKDYFLKRSPKDFLNNYDEIQEDELVHYKIKKEILLPNFKDFFMELHGILEEKEILESAVKKFNTTYDDLVVKGDIEKFMDYFEEDNGFDPFNCTCFFPPYISCIDNLAVYRGSYKAILEEYSTLYHIEKLLVAAMKNPLAKLVRMGMFG